LRSNWKSRWMRPEKSIAASSQELGGVPARRRAHRLPRPLRPGERRLLARRDVERRLGAHQQRFVRRGDQELGGRVAEIVVALGALAGRGLDLEAVLAARLPGQGARREVQQLLRERDRRRVGVVRFVDHVQAHRRA